MGQNAILFIPTNPTYILKFHIILQKEIFVPTVSNRPLSLNNETLVYILFILF